MAEMLKFKKGLHASLPETYTAGTVYVTTDEQAMYVDISDEKRIRLGQIVSYNTIEDFQSFLNSTKPPYSTEAFYYVADKNALLKWVAENGDTSIGGVNSNGAWKQINSTKDVADAISRIDGEVSALKGTVGNATSGLVKDVNDLKTTVGNSESGLVKDVAGHTTDIENLKKAVGMGDDGEVEGIGSTVAQLSEDLDALELEVHGTDGNGGIKATLSEHTGKISALEQASAQHALKTDLDAYAKTETIKPILDKVDTEDKTVSEAIAAAVKVEADRAKLAEEANANAASAAQGKANDAYALAGTKATLADVATVGYALATDVEKNIEAAISSEVTRADAKYATQIVVNGIDGRVSKNTSDISTINTALENVVTNDSLAAKDYATKTEVGTAKQEAIDDAATAAAGIYATKTALENTNDNVSAAQGRANAAYELAEGKTTAAEVKAQIEDYGYATTSYVDQAESDAVTESTRLGNLAYAAKSIEQTVAGHTSDLTTLKGAATVAGSVAEAKKAGDDAKKAIEDWKTAHDGDYTNSQIDTAVADAKKAGTDAAAQANTNKEAIASIKGTVDTLAGDVNTTGSVKKQIKDATDALETSLTDKITDEINAANAMEYIGGVASQTELNAITTPKKGDTYVVTAKFGNYYPGDLLIATGTEDENGTIPADNLSWTPVKTGYDATLEQSISGSDNKITLSSVSGGNKGEITFSAAEGSATTVSVANNTVTVGIEWDNF